MPLSIDIFNKKILSDQSRFGKYNILLSGDTTNVDLSNYYTKDNPSGFITNVNVVYTTGNQTITGQKTFDTIIANHFSGGQFSGPLNSNLIVSARGQQILTADTNQIYLSKQLSAQGQNITNVPSLALNWGNGGTLVAGGTNGVIDQRDGINPQQFRIFNATGTNSGEFATFGWQLTGSGQPNALVIGTQATQSGTLRNVLITGNSINIEPSGGAGITVDNRGRVTIRQNGVGDFTNSFAVRNPANNFTYFSIRDDGTSSFANQGVYFGGTSIDGAIRNGAIAVAQQNASNQGYFGWSRTSDPYNFSNDFTVRLYRGQDFVLDLRNPAYPLSGHQFRVFNTTGTNTGEFGVFGWQATGTGAAPNALVIGAQATQSGTLRDVILTGMDVHVRTSGITRISRNSTAVTFTPMLAVQRGTTNVFTVRDDGATEAVVFSTPLLAGHSSMNADGFAVRSVGSFRISSDVASFSPDVFLRRDGPGIFSQYNGINPQQYRLYNATGTNSGEFATLGWSGNTFLIAPQSTQSGINRNLEIHAAGFGRRIIVTNNGHVGIGTSAGDQTAHGIWVNPAAGQTTITHNSSQVFVNNGGVSISDLFRFWSNTRALGFGLSQNSTTPAIRGSTGIIPSVQTCSSDGTIFGGLDAAQLRVYGTTGVGGITSGEFGFLGWSTGVQISPTFVVGPQQTDMGILRDLTITGANINLASSGVIIPNPTVPTSTGSAGTRGQISWDDDFIYVCVSGNSWKRAALTTW